MPYPLPPYLGPKPCGACNCTGYTPCLSPPYACGGVQYCAQCQYEAGRIAAARTQIMQMQSAMQDSEVIAKAAAWGIVV